VGSAEPAFTACGKAIPLRDRHQSDSPAPHGGTLRCQARRDLPHGAGGTAEAGTVIFKAVSDGRPYPDHGMSARDWANVPPRSIRLDELVTTKRELALDKLLDEDSTFFGDLFPHAVQWQGDIYLEDGLHRALRAALQQRNILHVRVLDLDELKRLGHTVPS